MPKTIRPHPIVLLVEHEAIFAAATQFELEHAGYIVDGPFATCLEAMTCFDHELPDFAVLDIDLVDVTCSNLAAELTRRQVPFMIFSVHGKSTNTHPEFEGGTWAKKPATSKAFFKALANLASPTLH